MLTVKQQLVFMQQWREPLEEQGEKGQEMQEPVLLQVEDQKKNVLEQCPTVGVQDKETQV